MTFEEFKTDFDARIGQMTDEQLRELLEDQGAQFDDPNEEPWIPGPEMERTIFWTGADMDYAPVTPLPPNQPTHDTYGQVYPRQDDGSMKYEELLRDLRAISKSAMKGSMNGDETWHLSAKDTATLKKHLQ